MTMKKKKRFIFQSTPSVGRATSALVSNCHSSDKFQSTPSVGRATVSRTELPYEKDHFNPRPPWGGRQYQRADRITDCRISIHALRGEGDILNYYQYTSRENISIHALRGEGDHERAGLGRADPISIHALRGEGDLRRRLINFLAAISIHALRGEGDEQSLARCSVTGSFQSTPSVGRAT